MRLKTHSGELYFNPQLISHVHLSADRSLVTVHFVNGTSLGLSEESGVDDTSVAEFLRNLADEHNGFVATGSEMVSLKSALWIAIPDEGSIQVRCGDNRSRALENEDRERIRKMLAD